MASSSVQESTRGTIEDVLRRAEGGGFAGAGAGNPPQEVPMSEPTYSSNPLVSRQQLAARGTLAERTQPSLADLFEQGNVRVSPSERGQENYLPPTGGAPITQSSAGSRADIYNRLADLLGPYQPDAPGGPAFGGMAAATTSGQMAEGLRSQGMEERRMGLEEYKGKTPRLTPGIQAQADISKAFGLLGPHKEMITAQMQADVERWARTTRLVPFLTQTIHQLDDPGLDPAVRQQIINTARQYIGQTHAIEFLKTLSGTAIGMGQMNVPEDTKMKSLGLLLNIFLQDNPDGVQQLSELFSSSGGKKVGGSIFPSTESTREALASRPGGIRPEPRSLGEALTNLRGY